jgi:hypothetical protein
MTARAVSDLPEPDSPTRPSRSPGRTSKETPRTTSLVPARDGKATVRSSTVITGPPGAGSARAPPRLPGLATQAAAAGRGLTVG